MRFRNGFNLNYDVIFYYFYYRIMKTIDTNTLNNGDGQRNINKYKEKAAYLFQKLNNLQKNAEANKSQNQKILFEDFNQTEHVALESTKLKEGWYSHIISMITQI